MEDILQRGETVLSGGRQVRRAGSKVFFNRLLEENAVPVLWTANAVDEFDPVTRRQRRKTSRQASGDCSPYKPLSESHTVPSLDGGCRTNRWG